MEEKFLKYLRKNQKIITEPKELKYNFDDGTSTVVRGYTNKEGTVGIFEVDDVFLRHLKKGKKIVEKPGKDILYPELEKLLMALKPRYRRNIGLRTYVLYTKWFKEEPLLVIRFGGNIVGIVAPLIRLY